MILVYHIALVLVPLLFIMYVNDILKQKLNESVISFADDTIIIGKGRDWDIVKENLNNDMQILKYGFDTYPLSKNCIKSFIFPFQ